MGTAVAVPVLPEQGVAVEEMFNDAIPLIVTVATSETVIGPAQVLFTTVAV